VIFQAVKSEIKRLSRSRGKIVNMDLWKFDKWSHCLFYLAQIFCKFWIIFIGAGHV